MAESQVPLKLRKQMLLMRAAVERVELAQQMLDLRRASTLSAIVRNAMPGDRSRSLASRAFDVIKRYPFVASATSMLAARFKFPILAAATKWGGIATVGYKLWELWQQHRASAPAPHFHRLR
ncbi:MAG: hypothetical protein ABI277_01745 [Burkholderiaceae bacterium]